MKKDIIRPKVEKVVMAVVRETNELAQDEWYVHLINLREEPLKNILVSSKGYGMKENEQVKTSVLRHFIEELNAKGHTKVEKIDESVFGLNNEYFLSFYIDSVVFDKKYIFLAESIKEENLVNIPLLNEPGVMIA